MLLLWASGAQAQYWATVEACTVAVPEISAEALAPATLDELQEAARQNPNGTGNFWRIEAPGGAVSHLWGTYHSNDPHLLRLPEQVLQIIDAARVVAVELDPIAPSRRAIEKRNEWQGFLRDPVYGDTDPLADIDPEVMSWIRSRAHGIGWGRDSVDVVSVGGIASMLLFDPCNDFAHGTLPIQDGYIQMRGLMADAGILGLEHADDFLHKMNARDNLELALDVITLYANALDPDTAAEARSTSFALYLSGQNGVMQAWERAHMNNRLGGTKGDQMIDHVDAYMLDERNAGFLHAAQDELHSGGVFIAVGSFHLPGKNGMIELLRRAGFDVVRVPLPNEIIQ